MPRKAVVLGGTGLVGSHLIEELVRSDSFDEVVSLTRREINYDADTVVNKVIDFSNLYASKELFDGDCFFSCLGTTRKDAGSIQAQRKVDYDYQYQAAKFARQNEVDHYMLVSSSGARDSSPSSYLKMKGELETEVSRLGFKKTTFIQPSLLLGDRSDQVGGKRFAESLGAVVFPVLCKLPSLRRYQPIHAQEVAKRMVIESDRETYGLKVLSLSDVFTSA